MCAQLTAQISSQLNSSQRRPTIKLFPAPATERSCTRTYSDKRKPSTPSSTAMEALSTRWQSCLGIQTHFSLAERMGLCDGSTSGRSPNARKKIVGRTSWFGVNVQWPLSPFTQWSTTNSHSDVQIPLWGFTTGGCCDPATKVRWTERQGSWQSFPLRALERLPGGSPVCHTDQMEKSSWHLTPQITSMSLTQEIARKTVEQSWSLVDLEKSVTRPNQWRNWGWEATGPTPDQTQGQRCSATGCHLQKGNQEKIVGFIQPWCRGWQTPSRGCSMTLEPGWPCKDFIGGRGVRGRRKKRVRGTGGWKEKGRGWGEERESRDEQPVQFRKGGETTGGEGERRRPPGKRVKVKDHYQWQRRWTWKEMTKWEKQGEVRLLWRKQQKKWTGALLYQFVVPGLQEILTPLDWVMTNCKFQVK